MREQGQRRLQARKEWPRTDSIENAHFSYVLALEKKMAFTLGLLWISYFYLPLRPHTLRWINVALLLPGIFTEKEKAGASKT